MQRKAPSYRDHFFSHMPAHPLLITIATLVVGMAAISLAQPGAIQPALWCLMAAFIVMAWLTSALWERLTEDMVAKAHLRRPSEHDLTNKWL